MKSRRRFLWGVPALACSTAGCTATFGDSAVELEFVEVVNLHESAHEVAVQVRKDGSVVADRTVELPGLSGGEYHSESLDGEWLDSPGDFVVRARLAGDDDWTAVDLPGSKSESVGVEVMVEDDGDVDIFTAV